MLILMSVTWILTIFSGFLTLGAIVYYHSSSTVPKWVNLTIAVVTVLSIAGWLAILAYFPFWTP